MSLGLVAYDDSEESENESDTEPTQTIAVHDPQKKTELTKKPTSVIESGHISDEELESTTGVNGTAHFSDEEVESKSFNKPANLHLPESKLSLINTDIDIKCLTSISRKGGPVKITIPSLNEVNDEDEPPSKKKLKPSQKGSGLFALLPSPKSSLVPQSVSRKPTPAVKKSLPVASAKKAKIPVTKASTLISYEDSGDEEEVSGTVDFFSLESKDKDITPVDVNIDIPEVSTSSGEVEANASSSTRSSSDWQHLQAVDASTSSSYLVQPENPQQSDFGYSTSEFMTVSNSDLELDQQAMQQLCGRRDRIKMQEVNLIDVSGDKIMPDSREWLTKQLTEEVVHRPSHKRKDGPTSQQKRKHQITYLAYQAKENELELKNQWANNRMSRKQTQAKYGF